MRTARAISSFRQLKLLSDGRRLEILGLLMAAPATLTQLARKLGQSPAWVRHHVKSLEAAGLVKVDHLERHGRVREIFYRAGADALLVQEVILPRSRRPAAVFAGSHDLAVEAISSRIAKHLILIYLPVGSLDGLTHLREGLCQVAGTHLIDARGEYNTAYVRHLFPDRDMHVVTMARRTQGLMIRHGNPQAVKSLHDLRRPDVRFVERNRGSGTQIWTDAELQRIGVARSELHPAPHAAATHTESAARIANGRADAAIGLQAAALRKGLDFIPLFEERFDLVAARDQERLLSPLLDYLQTAAFREATSAMPGYDTIHSGELVPL